MTENPTRRVLLASLAASLLRAQPRNDTERESQAAATLFDGFESVFCSNRSVLAVAQSGLAKEDLDALDLPFGLLCEGFKAADELGGTAIIEQIETALTGAKNFRPPESLGGVQSDFCCIGILRGPGAFDLGAHLPGVQPEIAGKTTVWKWSAPPSDEDLLTGTLYATQVGQGYVLLSNSLRELESTAKQLHPSLASKLTLNHIPEWKSLQQRTLWWHRRYRRSETVDMDAAGLSAAGLSVVPVDATALTLVLDSKTKACMLRLYTSLTWENRSIRIARKLPPFRLLTAGVWEMTFPRSQDEEGFERMFVVLGMFGFGVYL